MLNFVHIRDKLEGFIYFTFCFGCRNCSFVYDIFIVIREQYWKKLSKLKFVQHRLETSNLEIYFIICSKAFCNSPNSLFSLFYDLTSEICKILSSPLLWVPVQRAAGETWECLVSECVNECLAGWRTSCGARLGQQELATVVWCGMVGGGGGRARTVAQY